MSPFFGSPVCPQGGAIGNPRPLARAKPAWSCPASFGQVTSTEPAKAANFRENHRPTLRRVGRVPQGGTIGSTRPLAGARPARSRPASFRQVASTGRAKAATFGGNHRPTLRRVERFPQGGAIGSPRPLAGAKPARSRPASFRQVASTGRAKAATFGGNHRPTLRRVERFPQGGAIGSPRPLAGAKPAGMPPPNLAAG